MKPRRMIGFSLIVAQLFSPFASVPASPNTGSDPWPLLSYASQQHFPAPAGGAADWALKQRLSQVNFDLARDPPPETDCARTLGAKRFATLYDDLGAVYSEMGNEASAADAFGKAIECNPRAGFLHAALAQELLHLGRYDEARVEAERQIFAGREDFTLYTLLVQLDFLQDRWSEAISHSRLAVSQAPDDDQATYWQCYLWLAQMNAGTVDAALAARNPGKRWPRPILEFLQGKLTEGRLLEAVKAEPDTNRRREILSEALFYAGEQNLASRRPGPAQRYFTATANLKVTYFIEHHLALAELSKLRSAPPDFRR